MLRTARIILAVLSIVAVTLLFLDFTGTAHRLWPWMAKIQFIPALLSLNLVALGILIVGTLMLGRVYCSIICPLGILQDAISWVHGRVMGKKKRRVRFKFKAARNRQRLIVLTVFLVLLVVGLFGGLAMAIAGLLEPYSAFGRIASQIFAPAYDGINNLLAGWSESQVDNYMFYRVAISVSIPLLVVAIITLIIIGVMSWRGGRDYCNEICPVGTMLGFLSRYSLLRPVIDTKKCVGCTLCSRGCKAQCIDAKAHAIDYSRCVACMDCIKICRDQAISYTWRHGIRSSGASDHKKVDPHTLASRRGFMFASGMAVASVAFEGFAKNDGGLTPLKRRQAHTRAKELVPAGAKSPRHLRQHCTACQLCIQACPQGILTPAMTLDGFMQPRLSFVDGFCQPDCVACSKACPVGAIEPIDEIKKSSIKIGSAQVDLALCLSAEGKKCGSCAAHCPAGAITMEKNDNGKLIPIVADEICIGCGACEYYCPVGTLASMTSTQTAIHVEGLHTHREL